MATLFLELDPKQAKLLWRCVVGQQARATRQIVERLDTYSDLPNALRQAADEVEYLRQVARQIAGFCHDAGVDVSAGMP
jgi:hypothetical protein